MGRSHVRHLQPTPLPPPSPLNLTGYRVRDLDSTDGTAARVRVLIEHGDGETSWGTIGVHPNIIEASWEALEDGVVLGLLRSRDGASTS